MQDEVYDWLLKHRGVWYTSTVVAKKMNISRGGAARSLNGLYMRAYIQRRVINTKKYVYCLRKCNGTEKNNI